MTNNTTRLWLTYAWADNDDRQIDHVIQAIEGAGLAVAFDRVHLIPGQRIWQQLDAAISDPSKTDAWAIYATRASLTSEPCLEELAYALDRTMRSRGTQFPIIGIFPEPIDRALIPSSIATRLYVNLGDPDWAKKVAAGARIEQPVVPTNLAAPYHLHSSMSDGKLVIELRPRSGRWHPFVVLVPAPDRAKLLNVSFGPAGKPPEVSLVLGSSEVEADNLYKGVTIQNPIDPLNSAYVYFSTSPTEIVFGQQGEPLWQEKPTSLN
ncbi:MAG: toll/interleukin-1 receptor domain-containing protein [Alphaproteobacteria bacterium]|nr:toll/interleukin-1 receptor domain-containing protein [Alphaproteobacteria bacterium]